MQIRCLKWKGIPMWPPEWSFSDQGAGDEGILEDVRLNQVLSEKLITLTSNHLGDCRKGVILQENPEYLELVYHKLRENIGKKLSEIGELEIDLTPSIPKYGLKQAIPKNKNKNTKRVVNGK